MNSNFLSRILTRSKLFLVVAGIAYFDLHGAKAATNYNYSTTLDVSTGTFYYFTNNGVPSESYSINLPQVSTQFIFNYGDTIRGNILFSNSECINITNTTGTNIDSAIVFFYQSSPTNNANGVYGIQLLGVNGQFSSPNPSYGTSESFLPNSPFQVFPVAQVTTSSMSFKGFSYTFTNLTQNNTFSAVVPLLQQPGGPLFLHPANILIQGGQGDISYGTSGIPVVAPNPLNVQLQGASQVLSWNDPAFSLYAAPSPAGTFTIVPGANSPYTIPTTGPQEFFRLQSN